ncbi:MAG: hypothetical protein PUF08_01750 [Clostridiales bacterium]|nr:hypothetical protein [Clostridiales bacterium]
MIVLSQSCTHIAKRIKDATSLFWAARQLTQSLNASSATSFIQAIEPLTNEDIYAVLYSHR